MELLVDRKYKKKDYTIGKLYVDGVYFCDTLEDEDRGLSSSMSLAAIKATKIAGATAIPTGTYRVRMDTYSQKFGKKPSYTFCKGKLPRLVDVPAYEGVLIHIGNTAGDTAGCLLVGKNKVVGQVNDSTVTFRKLYDVMAAAHKRGETITIEYR